MDTTSAGKIRQSLGLVCRGWKAAAVHPRNRLLALIFDRRGVAAIEFAFVAPLLFTMYFSTMELSLGIETSKKVSRVGSTVADLVAQQPTINKAELEAIMAIGQSILQPYNRSDPTITVSAIEITNELPPKVKIAWSRKLEGRVAGAGEAAGTATTVPEKLKIAGTFLIRVESRLAYKPVLPGRTARRRCSDLAAVIGNSDRLGGIFLMAVRIERRELSNGPMSYVWNDRQQGPLKRTHETRLHLRSIFGTAERTMPRLGAPTRSAISLPPVTGRADRSDLSRAVVDPQHAVACLAGAAGIALADLQSP
jgi:Flp pilus assembly protein TadG